MPKVVKYSKAVPLHSLNSTKVGQMLIETKQIDKLTFLLEWQAGIVLYWALGWPVVYPQLWSLVAVGIPDKSHQV